MAVPEPRRSAGTAKIAMASAKIANATAIVINRRRDGASRGGISSDTMSVHRCLEAAHRDGGEADPCEQVALRIRERQPAGLGEGSNRANNQPSQDRTAS